MASQINIAINWDASANGAVLPTVNSVGRPLKKGDAVYVTAGGTVSGKTFQTGDIIVALQTKPTLLAHWGDIAGVSSLYKEYDAILTQVGTANPVATVLNASASNYLGAISFVRNGAGLYTATKANAFKSNKTTVSVHTQCFDQGVLLEAVGFKFGSEDESNFEIGTSIIDYDGGFNFAGRVEMSSFGRPVYLNVKVYN